jgi:hypothetical protein
MHRGLTEAPGITDPAELTKRTGSAVLNRLMDSTAATGGYVRRSPRRRSGRWRGRRPAVGRVAGVKASR